MTFAEAKAELKEIANGRYHALYFEMAETSTGKQTVLVRAYIDPSISSNTVHTYREALDAVRDVVSPQTKEINVEGMEA